MPKLAELVGIDLGLMQVQPRGAELAQVRRSLLEEPPGPVSLSEQVLPLARIAIEIDGSNAVIDCVCRVHHKTGVEMEALTGASIAALTIYDMCKAMSHDIVIGETRLMSKTGGKQDFHRE